LNIGITRCSNNFGPRQDAEKLIPNFILKLARNEKVTIYGDGKNIRDWIHVQDHCDAIYFTLINGAPGEIYNIGGGIELSNLELTKKIITKMKKDDSLISFVPDRLGHDRRYSVDSSKIFALGFSVTQDFEQKLDSTIDWYMNSIHD
jgi:dTDP-glucose 4,6-dehydratase